MDVFANYLAAMDDVEQRARMAEVLSWVATTFPQLDKRIAWKQPMFTDHGTYIIGFSFAKHHLAFAPEDKCLAQFLPDIEASGYKCGKKIVRIAWTDAIDYSLLQRMIEFNIADKADCTTFWRQE